MRGERLAMHVWCMMNKEQRQRSASKSPWVVRRTLDRNRNLLRAWREQHRQTTEVAEEAAEWLVRRGFNFHYHTHVDATSDGRLAVMCFDEGYVLDGGAVVPVDPAARD